MVKMVWKFTLPIGGVVEVEMPKGAEVLHVANQGGTPMLWALVDPQSPMELRRFRFAGTGHPIVEPDLPECLRHCSTWLQDDGALVFHLFEYILTED